MIIANEKIMSDTSGVGQVTRAKVNANARMFNFFSTMVYSNPYVAIWRELTANGIDAMKDAGRGDQSLVITLPTDFTPFCVVRDYGTGMTHQFMMDDPGFMTYTESTKTHSDELIGGFGIGSKAPLSYTDQFTIKSYIDGVVNVYSVFKDEDDCPCIAHLGVDSTTEPNGVEIMFPVEGTDVQSFRDAAYQILTYFNPMPELKNAAEQVAGPEYTVRTATWGFKKGAIDSRVVMGGIAYPIAKGQIREIDEFLDYGMDFYVPIGACSIALSREALQYDDKTTRVLKTVVDAIRPDIEKYVAEMFDNCKTLWEAESLYHELSYSSGNPHRQRMVRTHGNYKGKGLSGRVRPIEGPLQIAQVTTSRYSKSNYSYWTEGTQNPTMRAWLHDLTPKDISVVLLDDAPNRPVLRMRNYLENNDIGQKGVLIIRTLPGVKFSRMDWARLMVKMGRPNVKFLSEIEPATVVRGPSVARVKRILAYTTKHDLNGPRSGNADKTDTLPATGGYYIKMSAFKNDEGQITGAQLTASGIKPGELFYFNKQDFIDAGIESDPLWKPAIDAYNEKEKTYRSTHRNMGLASAFQEIARLKTGYSAGDYQKGYLINLLTEANIKIPSRGPLYQLSKLHSLVQDQLNYQDQTMRTLLEIKYDKEVTMLLELLASVADQYPELWEVVRTDKYVRSNWFNVYNKLLSK